MIKKGFTLVELLAVIIVLGIVSLITVPIITDAVNESRMKAFKDTALGILNTAKQTYIDYAGTEMYIEMSNFDIFTDGQPTSTKMVYSGSAPKNGYVKITAAGDATIIVYDQNYCAYKLNNKDNVQVVKFDSDSECYKYDEAKKLEG